VTAEVVAQTIQLILAPVVMVTSCAILLGAVMGHYAAINDRLRAMSRERLDLLHAAGGTGAGAAASPDAMAKERLREIDRQAPELLRRHRRVRDSLLAIYVAVLVFVVTMFVIALAAAAGSAPLASAALVLFLAGTAALLLGVALTALEIRMSDHSIRYEMERVLSLGG
jgi:hypothetical protein